MTQGNLWTVCISPSKQVANCRPTLQSLSPQLSLSGEDAGPQVSPPGYAGEGRRGVQHPGPVSHAPNPNVAKDGTTLTADVGAVKEDSGVSASLQNCHGSPGPRLLRWGRCGSRQGSAPPAASRSWTFGSHNRRAHCSSRHSLFYPTKHFQTTTQHHKPGTITL